MMFFLHILFMLLATLSIVAGIGVAIFLRKKSSWLKIHRLFNSFGVLVMSTGVIMAVIYIFETSGKHIGGLHQVIGSTAFIFAFVTLSLGFYQFKARNKIAVRTAHRLMGRFSLLLLLTAITLGLKLINIL